VTALELPEHDHQFVVAFYENDHIHYLFGPFTSREQARTWSDSFNRRYAPEGARVLYTRRTIYPVCAPNA
jgi:hypothetical protein